jgi:hypothetical protein
MAGRISLYTARENSESGRSNSLTMILGMFQGVADHSL